MAAAASSLDTLHHAETPEGIALALRPAGIVARGQAWLIDLLIRMGLFFVLAMVTAALGGVGVAFLLISYFLLEWFYPVAFELGRSGATPGKRVMGLQVVMDSGLPVTPGASIVRNLLRAADFLPFLYAGGAVASLLRSDFKRLGDMAAGTLVVYNETVRLHGAVPQAAAASFERYAAAARLAHELGIGVNAGHDLDLKNLTLFRTLPHLDEVSIGHALISRAIFVGLGRVVKEYLVALEGRS